MIFELGSTYFNSTGNIPLAVTKRRRWTYNPLYNPSLHKAGLFPHFDLVDGALDASTVS